MYVLGGGTPLQLSGLCSKRGGVYDIQVDTLFFMVHFVVRHGLLVALFQLYVLSLRTYTLHDFVVTQLVQSTYH